MHVCVCVECMCVCVLNACVCVECVCGSLNVCVTVSVNALFEHRIYIQNSHVC